MPPPPAQRAPRLRRVGPPVAATSVGHVLGPAGPVVVAQPLLAMRVRVPVGLATRRRGGLAAAGRRSRGGRLSSGGRRRGLRLLGRRLGVTLGGRLLLPVARARGRLPVATGLAGTGSERAAATGAGRR